MPLSLYVIICVLTAFGHFRYPALLFPVLPVLLIAIPFAARRDFPLLLNIRHAFLGLGMTAGILVLTGVVIAAGGKRLEVPSAELVVTQFLLVAFPEEAFFRGYLQQAFGGGSRSVVLGSALFSVAHLPASLVGGDASALLVFFPSLVMGWLYDRTGNILPGIIFHGCANTLWLSIR
jgi:membrane protease YdiL (CAAX protease family)